MNVNGYRVKTPVILLIFNRPEPTKRVFAEIARVKPIMLLIVADGPRPDRPDDVHKCEAARKIVERIDWPCEVLTNYSDANLGAKRAVASGLTWAFEKVEEAIILEDDCLPHPTFFRYCEELLSRYHDDERIWVISGANHHPGTRRKNYNYSYYFSRYNHVWGWASWRRAWRYFDVDMKLWPEVSSRGWLFDILGDSTAADYWTEIFDCVCRGEIDAWDYQWTFACWIHNGLSILPRVNLISNIGFGDGATHTRDSQSPFANLPVEAMEFPLLHPPFVIRNTQADNITQKRNFEGRQSFFEKLLKKLRSGL